MVLWRKIAPSRIMKNMKVVILGTLLIYIIWLFYVHKQKNISLLDNVKMELSDEFKEPGTKQGVLNYIASNLKVTYHALDNTNGFLSKITLSNHGAFPISGSDWTIYLTHFQYIDTDKFNVYNGDPHTMFTGRNLPQFLLQHLMGNCYMLQPTTAFKNLTSGGRVELFITGGAPMSARRYLTPNWYVATQDLEPRIITSTQGEHLSFVQPFVTAQQWLTSRDDTYKPFSSTSRFQHNQAEDLRSAADILLPTPLRIYVNNTIQPLKIDPNTWTIVYMDKTEKEASYLSSVLGMKTSREKPAGQYILLEVGFISLPTHGQRFAVAEAYTLSTDIDSIKITGTSPAGVFHGVTSLLQLIDMNTNQFPIVQIADAPRFQYRGIMIDISRNFHGKSTLMKMIDALSMYKMNVLHLHMADDEGWRLEIPGLEELTQVGARRCHDLSEKTCLLPTLGSGPFTNTSGTGYLSVSEYVQLLHYAADRHVQIIPEFDMPGHSHAAIKSMEARYDKLRQQGMFTEAEKYLLSDLKDTSNYISGQFFTNNAINPCMESSYMFVEHVMEQVSLIHKDIMPLQRFHFGGDEVPQDAFVGSPACMALMKRRDDLQTSKALKNHFVRRVASLAAKYGLGLQGWEDGFESVNNQPYPLSELGVKEAVAHSWYNIWDGGLAHRAHEFANADYKVVLSHVTHLYFDAPQEPDPEERGLFWATRYIDMKRVFYYTPDSVFDNVDFGYYGNRINKMDACSQFINCIPMIKPENVIGMQAQAWSETMRTEEHLGEMLFPRVLALAERAWHRANWEAMPDKEKIPARQLAWQNFANTLGYRELKKLERIGIPYYLPPPGIILKDGFFHVNTAVPGLPVEISVDGGATWRECSSHCKAPTNNLDRVVFASRSFDGKRHSRLIHMD